MSSLTERDAAPALRHPGPSSTSNLRSIGDRPRLVVGIVAAYPSVRAGLAALIQVDRALTPMAIQPQSLLSGGAGPSIANLATIDLVVGLPDDARPREPATAEDGDDRRADAGDRVRETVAELLQ